MSSGGKRELTDEQKAVVRHQHGHALVEAGPGSGKTTVLVAKLRRMIKTGSNPSTMLVLMFNKSAQVSFEARLQRAIGDASAIPEVKTLHSVGYRILKGLVACGALPREKLVTSGKTEDGFARKALKAAWMQAGKGGFFTPAEFQGFKQFITLVKAQLESAETVFDNGNFNQDCRPYMQAFYALVREQAQRGVIFFDDLIYRPMCFLEDHPDLWHMFADRYDDILVDEFQDINAISFYMVKGLVGSRASCVCVGDSRQAIYGFRGSRVSLMTKEFEKVFSPCVKYPMSRTFRFGHEVALLANNAITLGKDLPDGLVIAHNENPQTRVERMPLKPGKDSGVVELLAAYANAGRLRETAMLARNFSHLVPYEIELAEAGIPYHVYGRVGLLFLPEIAALVCAVSLVANYWIIDPDDRGHFIFSLLTTPSPFVSFDMLADIADEMEPYLEGPERGRLPQILAKAANTMRAENQRGAKALDERADVLRLLTGGSLANTPVATIVKAYIAHTRMREVIERAAATPEQAQESLGNLDAFVKLAERAGSVDAFMEILTPMAALKEEKPPEGDHAALTTLHRSKGLEWPLVMMVGLTRGVFPSGQPDSDEEEERRLYFVGVTRAMQRLVLFHPHDETLERTIREPEWHPGVNDLRTASPYLYDSDLAPVASARKLIEADAVGTITMRHDRAMGEYMATTGARVSVELTPQAQALQKRAATGLLHGIIEPGHRPKDGGEYFHPDHGHCVVTAVLSSPICMLRKRDTGEVFTEVLQHGSEWTIPPKRADGETEPTFGLVKSA